MTTLACGGAVTGCGGDDNGGNGGGGDEAGIGFETGTPSGDGGKDAGRDAVADGATEASANSGDSALTDSATPGTDSSTPDSSTPDSSTPDSGTPDSGVILVDAGSKDSGPDATGITDATVPTDGSPIVDATSPVDANDGAAAPPIANYPVSPIGLGAANCGGAATPTDLIVTNTGGGTLTVTATVPGNVFSVTPTSLSLTAGQRGTLTVHAAVPSNSTAGATLTGSLTLATNDPAHSNPPITLTTIATGVTLVWSPSSADFGTTQNGVAATPIGLMLTNTGNAPATALAFGPPTDGRFSLAPTTVASLPVGASANLSAGFTPTSLTAAAATSSISLAAPVCGNSATVLHFAGQGGAGAVTGWPSSTIDFQGGSCGGAAPAPRSFTLTNSGNLAAHISAVNFSGTAGYTTNVTPNTAIAPNGGTLVVTITPPAVPQTSAVPGPSGPTPAGALPYGATVAFTTDVPGDAAHSVGLTEHAVGAILSFDTSATPEFGAFGNVSVGSFLDDAFDIVNSGNAPSNVTLSTTTPFSLASSVFSVQGNQPFADRATFTPTSPILSTGRLTIAAANLCQPLPAPLTLAGQGEGGAVSISASSLAFAANCGSTASPQTFTIQNTGNQPMTWSIAPDFNASLYNVDPPGATLDPNATSTVTVTPAAIPQSPSDVSPALFATTLHVTTTVVGDTTHNIALTETPRGDIITFVPAPPGPFDLGPTPISTRSQAQTFQVVNNGNFLGGNASLAITSGSGSFSVPGAISVAPAGGSFNVPVTFNAPGGPGVVNTNLTIATDDALCAPIPNGGIFPVTATATEAGPSVQPAAHVNFGLVNCGSAGGPQNITITNTGNQDFHVTSVGLNGTAATETTFFRIALSGGTLVQANNANAVILTVTPKPIPIGNVTVVPDTATYSGSVQINTDANVTQPNFSVSLDMGAQGVIVANPLVTANWAFPTVAAGSASTFRVPIQNTGNAELDITLQNLDPVFSLQSVPTIVPGGTTRSLVSTFQPTTPSTTSNDVGAIQFTTPGSVFCSPFPPSWGTGVNLTGSSTSAPIP